MEITSIYFLLFVLGVLAVYYLIPSRTQNIWLLIASYSFYIFWSWQFAILLLAATLFHFKLAKYLRNDNKRKPLLLWLGIAANVLLFIIFKASSFYFYRLVAILDQMGVQSGLGNLQIIIPLGLSYYVLQNISYLVDVYRGQSPVSTNLVNFSLYVAYFPKIVAGPIERAQTFLPVLAHPRKVDGQALARNLVLIFVGLTRKLLIADVLFAHLPWGDLINNPSVFSKMELIGWLGVYSFGLYNDFAGYTGIVRGISGLFGIELSPNFKTPYFSKSFTEFWNRWHITLSQWLRDYIFFPVNRMLAQRSSNRKSWQLLVIPPVLTMLASGFWHGPNLQMLLWGGIHGIYLIFERLISLWRTAHPEEDNIRWRGWVANVIVFLLVTLAWIPFAMRIPNSLSFWQQLWTGNLIGWRDHGLIFSLLIVLASIWLDFAQYNKTDETFFLRQNQTVQAAILAMVIILILVVISSDAGQPFVYQGF